MTDPAPRTRGSLKLGAARQQDILGMIARGDILAVGDLAQRFGVSQETIRRDIRALDEAGHLRRVHGGATPPTAIDLTARRPLRERLDVERTAKTQAAKAALPLFEGGMNVFLGGSSTMLLLADEIARHGPALSVTTNMIDIATVLAGTGHCSVTLLGGVVKAATHTLVGPDVLRALDQRVFDLAVCGASAVDPVHGFLGPSAWHAAIGTTLAQRSHRLAFVVDATKFGRIDAHIVQPFNAVDALATDLPAPPAISAALEAADITLYLGA